MDENKSRVFSVVNKIVIQRTFRVYSVCFLILRNNIILNGINAINEETVN